MKRLIPILLVLFILFSFSSCKGSGTEKGDFTKICNTMVDLFLAKNGEVYTKTGKNMEASEIIDYISEQTGEKIVTGNTEIPKRGYRINISTGYSSITIENNYFSFTEDFSDGSYFVTEKE